MGQEAISKEHLDEFERRKVLQGKLQEAVRRSAPASELRRIQAEIEELNKKIESAASFSKKP